MIFISNLSIIYMWKDVYNSLLVSIRDWFQAPLPPLGMPNNALHDQVSEIKWCGFSYNICTSSYIL